MVSNRRVSTTGLVRGIRSRGIKSQKKKRKAMSMGSRQNQPQSDYPYCALPEGFYDRLTLRKTLQIDRIDTNERTLFSIRTWDGRDVLKIDSVA